MGNFKDEVLNHYTDEKGFVTIDKNPGPNTTGNGFLHLALFCTILAEMNWESDLEDKVLIAILSSEVVDHHGIFHRNPWKKDTDLNSWEEYFAIVMLSEIFDFDFALAICNQGIKSNWVFDNQHPNAVFPESPDAYHDRFLGLTATYKLCAKYPVVAIEIFTVFFSIIIHCFTRKTDTCIREYIRTKRLAKKNIFVWVASKIWQWQAKRKFVTLGQMVKPYFGETHPLSKLEWV